MKTVRLGNHISLIGGGTPSKDVDSYWNGDIPWASVKDFKSDYISSTVDSITEEGVKNSATRIIPAGTLLIATRMAVGKVAFPEMDVAINQDLKAITCNSSLYNKFLFYLLKSKSSYFESVASGATVQGIKINHILDIEIPLPPLPVQQKIAAILDAADAYRQKTKALIDKYDQLAQSLFLDMFGDPRVNENAFEKLSFNNIATQITDGEHITPKRELSGYKLLSCRNIKNGYIDFSSGLDYVGEDEFQRIIKRCKPERNDILISCSGTIGRTTVINIDEPFVLVRSAALVKLRKELVNPQYIESYLRTSYMQTVMMKNANTSSQSNLFTGPIKGLPVLVPPLTLQTQFAERIQLIEAQKQQAQASLQKAEELFNSLLQKAFNGELVG